MSLKLAKMKISRNGVDNNNLVHKQCDIIRTLPVSNVNIRQIFGFPYALNIIFEQKDVLKVHVYILVIVSISL